MEPCYRAFSAGRYAESAGTLDRLAPRLPRSRDYVLFLAGESAFYAGRAQRARALFEELARAKSSRLAAVGAWRAGDCLWAEGRKAEAVAAYRKLLATDVPTGSTYLQRAVTERRRSISMPPCRISRSRLE